MKPQTSTKHGKSKPELRAIETHRLTFTVNDPLESHGVPNANQYALGGDQYTVPADCYDNFVKAMKKAGFIVRTVWNLYNELPYLRYQKVSGGFWPSKLSDDPDRWYYLSPITRRWRRVPHQKNKLLLRNGWALCHFPEGKRQPEFYFLERGKPLEECKLQGDVAIRQGYAGVVGRQSVPFWEDDEHLYILWPGYVIPKEHQYFLTEHLSLGAKLETEIGEIWLWRAADRNLAEKCLKGLHLDLHPWSPSDDWIPTLTAILTRSYSQLLKKKSNLPFFQSLIRRRAWDEIEDETLCRLLRRLGEAEYKDDVTAYRLLRFLSEKLPTCIEWREYPNQNIFAFVLESSSIEYQDQDTGNRYYRLVLPDLEIVAGWQTSIMPDWKGEQRQSAIISHWRVLPFLGRMRTSSVTQMVTESVTPDEVKEIARAIIGIPSMEWKLADSACIDAFNIDLDPTHWRKHHDLMRYFLGYSEILRPNPAECDTPSLLMQDMSGFKFILEVSGLMPHEIPQPGEWVRFIARSSLIEHASAPMPSFVLVAPRQFAVASRADALYMTLLAIVKYHFGITVEEMTDFLTNTPMEGLAIQALTKLTERRDVVKVKNRYFYRYTRATTDQVRGYAATRQEDCLILPYPLLRGILHPLGVQASYLRDEDDKMLHPIGRPPGLLIQKQDEIKLVNNAIKNLESEGAVYISGIGFKRSKVAENVVNVISQKFEEGALQIRRYDSLYEDDKGNKHPQRQYLVLYPVGLLKHKFR